MTVETKLALTEQDVRSFSEKMNEAAWMTDFRANAFAKLEQLPMPKPDKTRIDRWNFLQFPTHTVESTVFNSLDELPEEAGSLFEEDKAYNVYVQHNNTPAFTSLSEDLQAKGVILTDIFTATREHEELVKKYYMTDGVKVDEHKLTALNAAYMNGGVFVYVPKNVVVEEPIQALFLHDDAEASLFNHVIVVAEANSQLTYIENYMSTVKEAKGQANIVAEVITGDNAHVTFGAVDLLAAGLTGFISRRGVTLGRDSHINWALGLMNDSDTIYENYTDLIADGSESHFKSVVIGRGKQRQNFTTKIKSYGKNTNGMILKHGVVNDESTAIFNGIGSIAKGGSGSNAEQESRMLILNDRARADANPILLIAEDEVTAGHAATVGRVDPLELFYLMSRGISKQEAERLIIRGFLQPVVEEIAADGMKKLLAEVIERKLR